VRQVEMLCKLPKFEKSRLQASFLPIFLLNISLSLAPILWVLAVCTPTAVAQVPNLERTEGMISGTVLSKLDDRPVEQAAVSVKSHSLGVFRSILTDYDGRFELRGLPAGTYVVVVEQAGYESLETKAQFEGSPLKLVLHLMASKFSQPFRNNYTVSVQEMKIPDKARNEYRKGLECMSKNDEAGSLRHFMKATQVYPAYYEAYYHLGVVETRQNRLEEAKQAFQTAIEVSGGKYAWAEFGFGYALFLEGKTEEAEAIIRQGLVEDENSPDGYTILGMTLLRLNRLDEAEKSARQALLRRPGFAQAYLVIADVYARRRDYRVQVQNLDAYLQLEPTSPASVRVHEAREAALKLLAEAKAAN
jgi:tetratricopeptide (TPR) repeat protein